MHEKIVLDRQKRLLTMYEEMAKGHPGLENPVWRKTQWEKSLSKERLFKSGDLTGDEPC